MPEMGMRMTMLDRRGFLAGATTLAALGTPSILRAEDAIKIGEVNSYTAQPAFLKPYRQGWELAQEKVNAGGGVNGRKIETVFRDDGGKPEDAVRYAGESPRRGKGGCARRRLPVEHRARAGRRRQSEEACLRGLRTSHRRARLGQGQSLHLSAAPLDLYASRHARRRGGEASRQEMGAGRPEL